MNMRRMLSLMAMVAMLMMAMFALVGSASADGGADKAQGADAMTSSDVDLRNYGVEWGGSGYNTWYITTKNVGSKAAGGFYVRVAKMNGTNLAMKWVPGLAAGATVTVSVTTTDKCLMSWVDYGNKVPEYNESNNYIHPCSPFK